MNYEVGKVSFMKFKKKYSHETYVDMCPRTFGVMVFAQSGKKSKQKASTTLQQADSLFLIREWSSAVQIYEAVLKREPNNSLAWNRLGFSYHNLSNYDKAISSYLKSLEYKPNTAMELIVQWRLGRVYSLKNENEKAFQSLDAAVQ